MKILRTLVGLWLITSLVACNLFSYGANSEPVVTPAADITATVTEGPTATPSPTPAPEVRITTADKALFYGDFVPARNEYQAAYYSSIDNEIRAAALYGLGRTEYEDSNFGQALAYLRELPTNYPDSQYTVRAYFLLGQTYAALSRYQEAAEAFSSYLALRPGVIDSYTQELRGEALQATGDFTTAISAYQAALQAPQLGDGLAIEIKIAKAYAESGNAFTALTMYDSISSRSNNDYIKAQMDLLAGQAFLALGQPEQAYQRFLHAVDNYPLSYDSYSALVALVDAGVPVDELNRGLVDFYAGQYGVALAAFNRYLEATPAHDGTVYHYRALTLRALGYNQEAIADWSLVISAYPNNRYWQTAWEEKAETQWDDLEDYDAGATTLLDFVAYTPTSPNAPLFLLNAGRIYERANKLSKAITVWERLANEYPGSELAPQAHFWAGIAYVRAGNIETGLVSFQRSLILSTDLEDQARAYLWIGKMQLALSDTTSAQASFQQAATADPNGYYSERARDILFGRGLFEPPPTYDLSYDLSTERKEAEAWMRVTFNLPADTDLGNIGQLANDGRLIRGTEMWQLGLYAQAGDEFDDLRRAVSENPADCYRLTNYLFDMGAYSPAIFAARQVLTLAGMDTEAKTIGAPRFFNHVRFGTYYQDLILVAAQEKGFHPLFLFSVVRQESLFEAAIISPAGARGLMQIIPSTGESIAENMGWPPDFTTTDLYRPLVSIYMGTDYLASNQDYFEGDIYAALAAYNAGPGAAQIWRSLSGSDPDLFLEVIRYGETQLYIKRIFEIYIFYRLLYGSIP